MAVETNGRRISRDDLQAAFAKVIGDGQETVQGQPAPDPRGRRGGRGRASSPSRTSSDAVAAGTTRRSWRSAGSRDAIVDYLLRRLVRSATRRGMRGEHWAWFVLAAGAYRPPAGPAQGGPGRLLAAGSAAGDRLLVSIRSPKGETRRTTRRRAERWATATCWPTGERVLLIDAKQRRYLLKLRPGDSFHTHAGHPRPRRRHRECPRAAPCVGSTGREFLVFRPDAGRRRAQDAPRGPGHLSEGSRRDPDRGRRRPGPADPRGRRGLRCALDGAAAGRGAR